MQLISSVQFSAAFLNCAKYRTSSVFAHAEELFIKVKSESEDVD